ncbi:TPA: hypothetical protein N0F65_010520 [Lagenidium giganteum]|uniref:EF-hand domain-containing protein n=1 Tax=Lagenidium giganteum TaxID=4803 RepID=A0AAV2Z9Z9_9STRA|nr:TPA: hypothetical protein N0F65_010520 [Lagenidium giganteum]
MMRIRRKKRRQPVMAIFPHGEAAGPSSSSIMSVRRGSDLLAGKRRPSICDQFTPDNLTKLEKLFELCDYNEDKKISPGEVELLLELVGLRKKAINMISEQSAKPRASYMLLLGGIDFDEFIQQYGLLILELAQYPQPDFLSRSKSLRTGFKKCDTDNDCVISRIELEIALQKLGHFISDDDLRQLMKLLDRNGNGTIEWSEYLHAAWNNTLRQTGYLTIDSFNDLPSTIVGPAELMQEGQMSGPPPPDESMKVMGTDGKSRMELIGTRFLVRVSMNYLRRIKRKPMRSTVIQPGGRKAINMAGPDGPRTGFPDDVRRQMKIIEARAIIFGALLGIALGLISIELEQHLPHTELLYLYVSLVNTGLSVVEVMGMYMTAVTSAFHITVCTNLVLYPQDAEREFLTRSIARAAFQVGPRKDKVFGIDPLRGSRYGFFMWLIKFSTRRYVLRFMIRFIVGRVLWRVVTKSALPWGVIPLNALMNGWTLRQVMRNCRVSIIGPPCAISILDRFMEGEDEACAPFQRVDYMRVIGCVMVCKRAAPPNLEIVINHMRDKWMHDGLWPRVDGCVCLIAPHMTCRLHPLDDIDRLLVSLKLYTRHNHHALADMVQRHTTNMVFLLIIALVIDGNLDWAERNFYVRACHAAHVQNKWQAILRLKDDFVAGKGIDVRQIYELIEVIQRSPSQRRLSAMRPVAQPSDDEINDLRNVPLHERLRFMANRLANMLSI